MEVLSQTRSRAARIAALTALLSLAGCMLVDQFFGETHFGFSHQLHVMEEGLDCFSCHETAMMADDPGMPVLDSCAVCHDDIDADLPPERRVESLFVNGAYQAVRASALDDEVIFSHEVHATSIEACSACHTDIETNVVPGPELASPMDDCVTCHAQREVANECADCHTYIDEDWEPESHHHNWTRAHGPVARGECLRVADNCELCHTESTCVNCHLEEPPVSHNSFFRHRGHGLLAQMDRQSCATCHTADSCEQCHSEALPQNHVGAFGGTQSNHCVTCHFPLQNEGCVTCHKATPSHLSTPKPPGHHPLMVCRSCHGNTPTAVLPHADKGDDCNLCHP
jgi:hypothetical protein